MFQKINRFFILQGNEIKYKYNMIQNTGRIFFVIEQNPQPFHALAHPAPAKQEVSGYQELIAAFKESNPPCITSACACAEYKYILEMHKNTLSGFLFFSVITLRMVLRGKFSLLSIRKTGYFLRSLKEHVLPGFDQRHFQHHIWEKNGMKLRTLKFLC